jgi:NAD(P)-dependent dehydrogenase (short-subunit alcohol dehydrogenase family)
MYPSLKDRTVVVTGGGTGIGAAMVEAFSHQGARVYFLDVAKVASIALRDTLAAAVYQPEFRYCDLRDVNAISKTFAEIAGEAGPVEILVNNAANDDRHGIGNATGEYWDERIAVNLRHHFFCSQSVIDGMRKIGRGVILNLGSISWHLALPDLAIYQTAKAGIEGLTRGLARDLGRYGIRVNCIVPGAVRTPRQMSLWQTTESEEALLRAQCLAQRIEPDHVARMALFLASDDGARCTGRDYFVDAGWYGS